MVNAALLASVLVLLLPGPALAWSDIGHRIICEIAFQELGPTARERGQGTDPKRPRIRHVRRGLQLA